MTILNQLEHSMIWLTELFLENKTMRNNSIPGVKMELHTFWEKLAGTARE